MKNDISISLKDMLRKICLKWRMAIVFIFILAVVVDIAFAYRDYKVQCEEAGQSIDELEILENNLNQTEKDDVMGLVQTYKTSKEKYNNMINYFDNSILMQVDANAVSSITVQYVVTIPNVNDTDAENIKTKDIISALDTWVNSSEVTSAIVKDLGWSLDNSYIQECIMVDDDWKNTVDSAESEEKTKVFSVKLFGLDEESCYTMAKTIENMIDDEVASLQASYGNFTVTFATQSYALAVESSLLVEQQQIFNSIMTLRNSMSNLPTGLTSEQGMYYSALIKDNLQEESDDTVVQPAISLINIKIIIVGIVMGILLFLFVEVIRYLLGTRLRIPQDITDYFEIPLLGTFYELENKRFGSKLDNKINAFFDHDYRNYSEDKSVSLSVAKLLIEVERKQLKNIAITSSADINEMNEIINTIKNELQKNGVSVLVCKSLNEDPDVLKQLINIDGVVLAEKIGVSSYIEVKNELINCKEYSISVIGCIVKA